MRMAGTPKRNNDTVSGVFGLLSVNGIIRMSELQSISNNHISFDCACGHSAKMSVSLFIEKYGKDTILNDVVKNARCCWCEP